MNFYAITYPIRFEDTMAYGSHHFLTNFRFQCDARESLLFEFLAQLYPGSSVDYADFVMLTRDGYSRNLAPAMLGERVAVLVSFAMPTRSSMQLCVRTINNRGEPVACGFQTIVFMDRAGGFLPFPQALDEFSGTHIELGERLVEPSFAACAVAGGAGVAAIFPPEIRDLGKRVALDGIASGGALVGIELPSEPPVALSGDTVFSFPGQGSFDIEQFRELRGDPVAEDLLTVAEPIVVATLGSSLRRLLDAPESEVAGLLAGAPDLDQFGMLITELLWAGRLMAQGIKPASLIGHSFGEIAALCVAGCVTPETAFRIVAERVRALRSTAGTGGGMLALAAPAAKVRDLLTEILPARSPIRISVINTPAQTVLSGPRGELERLIPLFGERRIGARLLPGRYAFHSPALSEAARMLVIGLVALPTTSPSIPVYSPILGRFYRPDDVLSICLSSHLTRPLDFPAALDRLRSLGMRRIVECGSGNVLTELAKRVLSSEVVAVTAFALRAEAAEMIAPRPVAIDTSQTVSGLEPIAIVSMGCVVPGARNPAHLWRNVLEGVGGIIDWRAFDPTLEGDLMAGSQTAVVPDKTYASLTGYCDDVDWRDAYPFDAAEFAGLSKPQRLLTEALAQARLSSRDAPRTVCLLGSTADGIREYDDALFHAGARDLLDRLLLPEPLRLRARAALEALEAESDPEARSPFPSYSAVVARMLGAGTRAILLDAACASSLYALDLGMHALRANEIDLAYVGGVFSPGPSNSALFAQFSGLSKTGSHALDRSADGVVFGEGAAILGIRRLSDALARGETIHAVVRACGLSSDGQSVSVNVPKAAGQIRAMRAAYAASGIDPHSVQLVEAHATATPVGDATEFEAMVSVFGGRDPDLPRIGLGSIKSLLGHTGWLAGAVSIIKIAQALTKGIVPPQHGWTAPNPRIDLDASPFAISTAQQMWPRPAGSPRRAGVNGFGFGGTNAHVVLEAYDPAYHRPCDSAARPAVAASDLVCIGFGGAFAGDGSDFAPLPDGRKATIGTDALRLPRGKRAIPDALEHMDTAQFAVLAGADRAFAAAGIDPRAFKERTGIVIGAAGKARRGVAANLRVLADRLRRQLEAGLVAAGEKNNVAEAVASALAAELKQSCPPSNPYTLVGMMPNLVAGRVSNVFDLSGPNLVVDTGPASLSDAVRVAGSYLRHGVCEIVLAGGVNATAPWPRANLAAAAGDGAEPDGAVLMLLTRRDTALERGFPILGSVAQAGDELILVPHRAQGSDRADIATGRPHEVVGIAALATALSALGDGGPARHLRWTGVPPAAVAPTAASVPMRDPRAIGFHAREAVAAPVSPEPAAFPPRILVITDQPELARRFCNLRILAASTVKIVVPNAAENERLVSDIDEAAVDLLLVLRDLTAVPPQALLGSGSRAMPTVELAFLAVRKLHQRIEAGATEIVALHLNAWPGETLHPDAALVHGLFKSLARDWPAATIRAIAASSSEIEAAASVIARELKLGPARPDVEIVELGSGRHALRFVPAAPERGGEPAPLTAESVVLLTGGARGVTAVMAEALLERYGCTLVLLGRSDPEIVPAALRSLSLDELDAYETAFYRGERARDPKRSIIELRREFTRLKAAHETQDTIARLRRLGRVDYRIIDITKPDQVDAVVSETVARHGGIAMVVHGAGVQISKRLSSRQLTEFQQVIGTKLDGLRNLHSACDRFAGPNTQFHILTSAFSALGNDGQPDYGAANEAMAAIARCHTGPGRWTALGWLGWASVGMTRGSEYAALGNSRGLRAVRPDEGKVLFLDMLEGSLSSPALSLLSSGEIKFYGLPVAEPAATPIAAPRPKSGARAELSREWQLDVRSAPYLAHHAVRDTPTLPGTFEVEFALQMAAALRPDQPYLTARNPRFHRFVRVPERGMRLRGHAKVIEESAAGSVIAIRLTSDFVHPSGTVLQADVLHFEGEVLTGHQPFAMRERTLSPDALSPALPCRDPFLEPGSPVRLSGMFACVDDIRVGPHARTARFRIPPTQSLDSLSDFLSPVLLLDALFRLLGLAPDGDVSGGTVSVPLEGSSFRFANGVTDRTLQGTTLRLMAVNPRSDGDVLVTDWGQVLDDAGQVIVSIEHAVARRMGAPARVVSAS